MFSGSIVALVTPFDNGRIDEEKFTDLINWHIEQGTRGIVACGTTGESATLSHEEHARVIDLCVEVCAGRIPVIAGTGSNSTSEAISLTIHAAEAGADAALLVTPYYNKPSQEGLYQHYKAIADAVDIPQIVYNVPGRTASEVLPETMARLAGHKNIIGVKDAGGSLVKTADTIGLCEPGFIVLSGDDFLTVPMISIGAKGVISVTANIVPGKIAAMVDAANSGDFARARQLHYETRELSNAMFFESNPTPVKTALAMMGKIREEFRAPLCPISQMNREKLYSVMARMELV